ncbi:hypothetical protein BJY04DRAFT_217206 [Aspergillus karnatakaensis]|uniref:uncharacterized protein n=1 Tax=Aspergillus karnatakaensis TaxID=1810916 RepID=UPI003CCD0096
MALPEDLDEDIIKDRLYDLGLDPDDALFDLGSLIPDWKYYMDPQGEFDWLEQIDGRVEYHVSQSSHSPPKKLHVADCKAFLIRRNRISEIFWGEMEEPEPETAELAFDLFDRYGRLQSKFRQHPVTVFSDYRRPGIGSKIIRALLDLASQKSEEFVAMIYPVALESEVKSEVSGGSTINMDEVRQALNQSVLAFCRASGFRRVGSSYWLAYSPDKNHPSHHITSGKDFDMPIWQRTIFAPEVDALLKDVPDIEDTECLARLERILGDANADDAKWEAADEEGNTLLHLTATTFKPRSTQWL